MDFYCMFKGRRMQQNEHRTSKPKNYLIPQLSYGDSILDNSTIEVFIRLRKFLAQNPQ